MSDEANKGTSVEKEGQDMATGKGRAEKPLVNNNTDESSVNNTDAKLKDLKAEESTSETKSSEGAEVDKDSLIEQLTSKLNEASSQIEDLSGKYEAVNETHTRLLEDNKRAREQAEIEAAQKKEELIAQAKEEGNYDLVSKEYEQKNKALREELSTLHATIAKEKVESESMKLSNLLADGTNAELLSEFVKKRLSVEDGQVLIDGGATTVEELTQEFSDSDMFKPLLRGRKSTGGGAKGSSSGVSGNSPSRKVSADSKTLTREQYRTLSPADRNKFYKNGGKFSD
jgi:chromosome segregation ATPase